MFFFFKEQNQNGLRQTGGLLFLKKTGFSQPWLSFNPFCDFPLIVRSGTSHVTISLIGCTPHT